MKYTFLLCRLRSIATLRDHFVRCPSVCPSVCHTRIAMFRRRHMHSSECCRYFFALGNEALLVLKDLRTTNCSFISQCKPKKCTSILKWRFWDPPFWNIRIFFFISGEASLCISLALTHFALGSKCFWDFQLHTHILLHCTCHTR